MTRIGILVGSTRPRRRAKMVANWVKEVAIRHAAGTDVTFEVIDLADFGLPLLACAPPSPCRCSPTSRSPI
jgi:NAD(P)H-dependent FMN reductase